MKILELRFRSGKAQGKPKLILRPARVTIFIGPNNGGKSRALSEIQYAVAPNGNISFKVFDAIDVSDIGDKEFADKLSRIEVPKIVSDNPDPGIVVVSGRYGGRQSFSKSYLAGGLKAGGDLGARQYAAQNFLRYFFINLNGTDRLGLALAKPAEPVGSAATSTISALLSNDEARGILSDLIVKAFGQYLVIDPTQMTQLRYMLSRVVPPANIERHLTDEAVAFFKNAEPLEEASDGTKAFVGIAAEIIAGDPDIVVVDEPEAFLHPSLAFLLGRYIAGQVRSDKQLYVATHSSAFLLGSVLSGAPVDVVRLTHRGGDATARHLSAERLREMMTDPLFRSAGAVSALFYESAVITEGDSDRAFYDEVNNRLQTYGDNGLAHNIFLNAHNKQTAVNLVVPLRQVGIPAAMILDLDWLKEDGQVWDRYFSALGAPVGLKGGFANTRRYIRDKLAEADANYKTKGGLAVLSESDRLVADDFLDSMEQYGLFTVRSGELESWLAGANVERTKNKWLASVFAYMGSDPDLPGYLLPGADDVWALIDRIGKWTTNKDRKGMEG